MPVSWVADEALLVDELLLRSQRLEVVGAAEPGEEGLEPLRVIGKGTSAARSSTRVPQFRRSSQMRQVILAERAPRVDHEREPDLLQPVKRPDVAPGIAQ